MQSHNKQHHYINELARLKKERLQRELANKIALEELKDEYIFPRKKKRSKTKSKRK